MFTSRLEVDLGAVQRNARHVREVVERHSHGSRRAGLCAVLKQDAYGMGAGRLAKRIAAAGARMIAVYAPAEGRAIIEAAVDLPILVLMPLRSLDRFDPLYRYASTGRVHLTVHGTDQLRAVEELSGRLGIALPVHVQLDTGMSRGGCSAEEATRVVEGIARNRRLQLAGLMTHFASAGTDEPFTREQAGRFDAWLDALGDRVNRQRLITHLSATSGVFRSARYHGGMVRVGQGLFGYAPNDGSEGNELGDEAGRLLPALRWTSEVVHEVEIAQGWPVGYGSTWRAARPSRIALVPVGYADGYPRSLSNAGVVGFSGRPYERRGDEAAQRGRRLAHHHAPVVGRVSMDQITIDVTDVPRELTRIGMEVELVGCDPAAPNAMPALARAAGTVTHDLMCSIGSRAQRVYGFITDAEPDKPLARVGTG